MAVCKHCNGTGKAPDRLTLECVKCQSPVTVEFHTTADLINASLNVVCRKCKADAQRMAAWEQSNG